MTRVTGLRFLLAGAFLALAACSDQNDAATREPLKEHVWQEQVRAHEKAKDLDQSIRDASAKQRLQIDSEGE